MYNYYNSVRADVLDYIREEIDLSEFDSLEELAEKLEETLWITDSVTGNASGSYTFNSYTAKEYVSENLDLLAEMCLDFGIDYAEIGRRFIMEEWEWFDVSIRCYVLSACVSDALEEIREEWEEIHNSDDSDENDD